MSDPFWSIRIIKKKTKEGRGKREKDVMKGERITSSRTRKV